MLEGTKPTKDPRGLISAKATQTPGWENLQGGSAGDAGSVWELWIQGPPQPFFGVPGRFWVLPAMRLFPEKKEIPGRHTRRYLVN